MAHRPAKKRARSPFFLDENLPRLVQDYLLSKGFSCGHVAALKEEAGDQLKDTDLMSVLKRCVFLTKDRGFLRAGAVPEKHRGVIVLDAEHLTEDEIASLVAWFMKLTEVRKRLLDELNSRRLVFSADRTITEVLPDGSEERPWPRGQG